MRIKEHKLESRLIARTVGLMHNAVLILSVCVIMHIWRAAFPVEVRFDVVVFLK